MIHGLGESGKTQVCLKFAKDYGEEWASLVCVLSLLVMMVLQILGDILGERKQCREPKMRLFAGG